MTGSGNRVPSAAADTRAAVPHVMARSRPAVANAVYANFLVAELHVIYILDVYQVR